MDGPGLSSIAAVVEFSLPQLDAGTWLQLLILLLTLLILLWHQPQKPHDLN